MVVKGALEYGLGSEVTAVPSATSPYPVATAEIGRRVHEVKHASTTLYFDVALPSFDQLTAQERNQWVEWQLVRTSHLARAQRRCASVACVASATFICSGFASGSGSSVASYAAVVTAVVATAACLAALLLEHELARHPAYLQWSVRTRLGRKARQRVDLQPLRNSLDNEIECGEAAYEARLLVVAADIVKSIRYSPLWRSDYLDHEHFRYDVRSELAVLSQLAVHLHHRRTSHDDLRTHDVAPDQVPAWSALMLRVALLYQYQIQLDLLARRPGPTARPAGLLLGESAISNEVVEELRWVITLLEEGEPPIDHCCPMAGDAPYRS